MIKTILSFGYIVEAEEHLIEEIQEETKSENTIFNWFNFNNGDIFYSNNCDEYIIQVNHDRKYIQLI